MATLTSNTYGKHLVRVLKVIRESDGTHHVCEVTADVLLTGDLDASYYTDNNQTIVPTDTIKNTVTVLAHDHLETCRTSFCKVIGEHFLDQYDHISGATVELRERRWERMTIDGKPHPHSFAHSANGTWFAKGIFKKGEAPQLSAGISDHLVMKTTESGFVGYNKCDLTTLPEATDRFMSTYLTAEWTFLTDTVDFQSVDEPALTAAHKVFATTYSPSVQRTLFEIGEAMLEAAPQMSKVDITMPNVHFLSLDLSKLGRPDQNSVVLPTSEPHGQIIGTVSR